MDDSSSNDDNNHDNDNDFDDSTALLLTQEEEEENEKSSHLQPRRASPRRIKASPAADDAVQQKQKLNDDHDDDDRNQRPRAVDGETTKAAIHDDDDDDDSDSEDASSGYDDSDDDDETATSKATSKATTMTLTEKRARNVRRNNDVLASLGIAHGMMVPTRKRKEAAAAAATDSREATANSKESDGSGNRGMLLSTAVASLRRKRRRETTMDPSDDAALVVIPRQESRGEQQLLRLCCQGLLFPHREAQMRKLKALLSVPVVMAATATAATPMLFVPLPIFVTGPAGCGKTAIVRDAVHSCCATTRAATNTAAAATTTTASSNNSSTTQCCAAQAYIDCAALDDTSSIEGLVVNAYTQLQDQLLPPSSSSSSSHRRKSLSSTLGSSSSRSTTDTSSRTRKKIDQCLRSFAPATVDSCDDEEVVEQHQTRRLSTRNSGKRAAKVAADEKQVQQSKHDDIAEGQQQQQGTAPTAVWMFGRALERLLLLHSTAAAAYLVVDHAERLLSLTGSPGSSCSNSSSTAAADRVNFLAQLLLLPRILGLNLTIIVITKSVVLEHSALNNVSAQGTIAGHINPIRIHFPAYRGKSTIQAILSTDNMKRLIVGEGASSSEFQRTVFRSFLETLVQSLYDLTSDIKEYVRLGRGLWPRYIAPVLAENIDKTLESIRRANAASKANGSNPTTNGVGTIATTQREILSLLDQRIFPHIRHALEHGFGALAFDSPGVVVVTNKTSKETSVNSAEAVAHDIPYLAKYLLLAAYVCQANRPDRDKQLFSIQTNGKKRRGANDDTGEDVAFGSGSQDRLKTLRPRAFPLERLYSLYVSMVSLNPSNEDDDNAPMNQDGIMLRSLGNVSFHETVAYLIDIGILHDYPKRSASDTIRISQRSLWSSITRDEAQEVAKSVKFPLDRYIL